MPFVLRPPGEVVPLPAQLAAVAAARRWATVFAGGFRTAALALFAVGLACGLDAAFHLPPVARALALLGILAGVGMAFLRGLWWPVREPMKPLGIAMLLEERYPRLNDALASAIEFHTTPAAPGTERFRKVAMARAKVALEKYDTSVLVPAGRAWKALLLMLAAGAAALPLALANRERATVAVRRLAFPYGGLAWPTKTKLAVTAPAFPARIAKGDPLEVRFIVAGVLPERATVAVRFEGAAGWEEPVPVPEGNPAPELAARLDASRVPRDFQVQVRAGDAATDWLPVAVAEPPRFAPRDGRASPQLHAIYPAYSRLPAADLPDGATVVEAVAGTRLVLKTATDRRIASAVLVPLTDRKPLATAPALAALASISPIAAYAGSELAAETIADIPVSVSGSEGTLLDADFTPAFAGLHALRFTDETGVTGTRLFDLRLTPDPAPTVTLEQPPPGTEPAVLLPTASVAFAARAEDRTFAVRKLALEYRVGGEGMPWHDLPLSDPPMVVSAGPALFGAAVPVDMPQLNTVAGGGAFPLAAFRKPDGTPPAPGDRLTLRAAAWDFDDVTALKAPGRSREVEIRVMSAVGLEALLQQQLAAMRPQVLKLREDQRKAREQVEEFARNPTAEAAANLDQAEREQQAVRNRAADPRDGLRAKAAELQNLLRRNALPRSPTADRVDAVADELARLGEQTLDGIEPRIAAARKAAGGSTDDAKKAADGQRAAEKQLEAVLERLEQWGSAGELRAEAMALKEQVAKAAADAAREAAKLPPGKSADQLTPGEKAALGKPAEKFNQLADRVAAALGKAERQAAEKDKAAAEADAKAPGSPEAEAARAEAAALREAVQQAGGQQAVNDLRAAGKALEGNKAGESADASRAAQDKLEKFAAALGEKTPDAADELAKRRKAADEIDALAEQQDQLAKKAKAAADDPDELKRLGREQAELKSKTEAAAERLARDRQGDAAERLRQAAEKMAAAQEALDAGQAPGEQQNEALERLQDAVDRLDREREREEAKLAREKQEQAADELKRIRDRLAATEAEAARLQADVLQQKGWDRGKIASLGDLDDRAKAVADDLRAYAEKHLEQLPVFKQLATQAADLSTQAAKRFGDRKLDALDAAGEPFDAKLEAVADDRTRRPLRTALRRLDHILSAMKEDKKDPAAALPAEKPEMPPDEMPMPMPTGDRQPPPTAQVKALRALQAELNERTAAFDKAHPDRMALADADREELDELERSQREVAELFQKLVAAFKPAPAPENP